MQGNNILKFEGKRRNGEGVIFGVFTIVLNLRSRFLPGDFAKTNLIFRFKRLK